MRIRPWPGVMSIRIHGSRADFEPRLTWHHGPNRTLATIAGEWLPDEFTSSASQRPRLSDSQVDVVLTMPRQEAHIALTGEGCASSEGADVDGLRAEVRRCRTHIGADGDTT